MPRTTHPASAGLRNRNRVTNKTRLKVIRDTIEADSIVLDEDEEKARVVSTAGVDAEDANEHHLQAVLSAAASRHQATRVARAGDKEPAAPAAYIPTPDSTGVVHNYAELYVAGRWKEPYHHIKSSDTVEEATSFALANGFIYYMDERDKEWLDKNNEQARGEGMSTQSASAAPTRSGRSAKAKGKEPDIVQPVSITEDEFELVMAIFEKVTHEKTEFLHHGLEQGAPFPPFSDYQDTFAAPLPAEMFAMYSLPSWIPPAQQMLRYSRIIYPYWRERRQDRGGHRIIPTVNLDESDTLNESYICFRRREIKAVRKTRASQTSYSDRMVRLQTELATALDVVRLVQRRELVKRDVQSQGHVVWGMRQGLVDLKRAHPSLGAKEDDDLFMDKEKPPKKPKVDTTRVKIRPARDNVDTGSPIPLPVPQVRPRERQAAIQLAIDQELQRSRDSKWEDVSDNPYQAAPVPYGCRLFKTIPLRSTSSSRSSESPPPKYRSARLRAGRGRGRIMLDRRFSCTLRAASFDDDEEAKEHTRKLEERFRYDDDEGLAIGSEGAEEHDRKLIDEHQPSRLWVSMGLLQNEDLAKLGPDPTVRLNSGEAKPYQFVPPPVVMKPPPPAHRQPSNTSVPSINTASPAQTSSVSASGVPVSLPAAVKKHPPSNQVHLRISNGRVASNGSSASNGAPPTPSPHATPPSSASLGGFPDAQVAPAKPTDQDVKTANQTSPNGILVTSDTHPGPMASPSPAPAKPPMSTASVNVPNLPNGYHIPVNGYPTITKGGYIHPNARHTALTVQQMQSLSAMLPDNNVNIALRQPGAYVMPPNGAYAVPMAGGRWSLPTQHSPPSSVAVDASGVHGTAGSPGRVPSTNSVRGPQRAMPVQVLGANQAVASPAGAHIARLAPHSSPHMLSPNLAAAQTNVHSSPTRAPQSAMPTPSPSLQSRQLVGGSGAAGY